MTSEPARDQKAFGRAVARLRKLRGMSQREFASVVDRSETWLSQVERGVRRIDRMTVLQRLADALGVPVSELAPDTPVAVAQEPAPEASSLCLALAAPSSMTAVLGDGPPADPEAGAAEVERVWERVDAAEYAAAGQLLTELVPDLEHAARTDAVKAQRSAFTALARAYQAYALVLAELGEPTGSWVAGERAVGAAERSGDALLMAASEFRLVQAFHVAHQDEYVVRAATGAVDALADRVAAGERTAKSLAGALRLQIAVAAARRDDAEQAYEQLDGAAALADGSDDETVYGIAFGPTYVATHRVAVGVELGDAGSALRTAARVQTASLDPERRARYLVDLARAHAQRRNLAAVVDTLTEAHELAPGIVVGHPAVRQLVTDLVRTGHDEGLHELAKGLAIPGYQ